MTTLSFRADWSQQQSDAIRAGEQLKIEYAAERLPTCRASYRGQDAWNIAAYARFLPSGEVRRGAVAKEPLVVDVPTGATQVELWFNNTDNTGCVAWDSRYGQNYRFDVGLA
jgi:uncharacterized protein YraI